MLPTNTNKYAIMSRNAYRESKLQRYAIIINQFLRRWRLDSSSNTSKDEDSILERKKDWTFTMKI